MLNLKKKLFTIALSLFCAGQLMAVPALPGKMVAKQADGTMITIQKLGDEHYHMTVTEDGYPLKYNFATNNYEYAELTEQGLVSSNIVAMPVAQRDARAKAYLQKLDKEVMMQIAEKQFSAAKVNALQSVAAKKSNANGPKRVKISDVPTTGKQKVLNILVEFSNCKFSMSDPKAYYDRFFHEKGFNENGSYGSVHDYYYEGSGHNYDPDIDCYGPIQVSGTYQSYAGNEGTENAYKMIQEACKLLHQQGVDLSPYDTDGDGVVDNVYVIYAGYGQADSNKPNTIWPHSWNLSNIGADIQLGNVKIDRYATSQEINGQSNKPVGIGTFVHEFGHVLGLADHYNTMNAAASNTPGAWDVMCAGSYNGDQNCPATFTAFERYSLDWLKLTELNATTDTFVTVTPLEDKNAAYRVSIPNKNYEYFIIENRQQKGWDKYIPGHGILVWHLDEDQAVWTANTVNNDPSHPRVDIVEADRRSTVNGDSGDSFPGTSEVTSFNFNGWYDRNVFGFAYVDETEGGDARFLLSGSSYKLDNPQISISDIRGRSAKATWTSVKYAKSYNVTLMQNGKALESLSTEGNEIEFDGLEPQTEYTAVVQAALADYVSDSVKVNFTTSELNFDERKVNAKAAFGITDDSFTASWDAVKDAQQYDVTLYQRSMDGEADYTFGFDEGVKNLPEGWNTSATTTSGSYYGEAKPSLRMNVDGMYLTMCVKGKKVKNLKFWRRSSNAACKIFVDEYVNGKWTLVGDTLQPEAGNKATESFKLNDADSVRISVRVPQGYVLIDDVSLTYNYEINNPMNTVTLDANNTYYTFSGLDNSILYSYSVVARKGDTNSIASDIIAVPQLSLTCVEGVKSEQEDVNAPVFDLQGRRVATLQQMNRLPKGLYIVNGKKIVVK